MINAAELDDVLDELVQPVCDLCDYAEGEASGVADLPPEIVALFDAAKAVKERYGFHAE